MRWRHSPLILLLAALPFFALSAEGIPPGDAPAQGLPQDYANYYLNTKRDGLEPFWKAQENMAPHEREFILNYRDVRKNQDRTLLDTLIHPTSLACENEMRAEYFAGMREFYTTEYFPDAFKVKFFPIPEERQSPLKQRMEFPTAPTHILYIEYQDGEYVEGLQRFLREETAPEPKMYELISCPSKFTIEKMRVEAELETPSTTTEK